MPLAEWALPRVKTESYWMNLGFAEPGDILSTTGPVVPEHYRVHVEENYRPASKIVNLRVLRAHHHKALDSEFGKFLRGERAGR